MDTGVATWQRRLSDLDQVVVDTNVIIYFLQQAEPYHSLATQLFAACESGSLSVLVSALVELELLVGPFRDNDTDGVERIQLFLDHFPNLSVVPIDRTVAQAAARARAKYGIATPDALVVGTALAAGCDAVIGNDKQWATRLTDPPYILLSDYLPAQRGE